MSAIESRHCHRNPSSAAVPYRQPIRCQPSDLVPCCLAPSRHRHSPPRQRPILFARLRSLPQPFVPCRRVAVEGRFHPSANLAYSNFCLRLPSQFCNFAIFTFVTFRRLSAWEILFLKWQNKLGVLLQEYYTQSGKIKMGLLLEEYYPQSVKVKMGVMFEEHFF